MQLVPHSHDWQYVYLRHSVKRLLVVDGKSLILTCVPREGGLIYVFGFVYFIPLIPFASFPGME